jgi:hypothetical protein
MEQEAPTQTSKSFEESENLNTASEDETLPEQAIWDQISKEDPNIEQFVREMAAELYSQFDQQISQVSLTLSIKIEQNTRAQPPMMSYQVISLAFFLTYEIVLEPETLFSGNGIPLVTSQYSFDLRSPSLDSTNHV